MKINIFVLSILFVSCLKLSYGRQIEADHSGKVKRQAVRVTEKAYCVCTGGFKLDETNTTYCISDCNGDQRLANEVDCTFPFYYNRAWYDGCTKADKGYFWCSIDKLYLGRYARCAQACPKLAQILANGTNNIHTSCIVKETNVISKTPTSKDIAAIVNIHNKFRSNVSPTAADMNAVVWDNDLARMAQKWSESGVTGHDNGYCRRLLNQRTLSIGQNAYLSSNTQISNYTDYWLTLVDAWHSEVQYFVYGSGSSTGNWLNVAHYTQIVFSGVKKIGCGLAIFPGVRSVAICNYAQGQLNTITPYTLGKPCTNCSTGNCKNNLCTCSKICQNSGTLDPVTCTCKCQPYAYGSECQLLSCNKTDTEYECWGTDPKYCKASNTAPLCPHMCGVCDYLV